MKRRLCTLATTAVLALAVQFGMISAAGAAEPPTTVSTTAPVSGSPADDASTPDATPDTTAPATKSKPTLRSLPDMAPMRRIHGPW